MRDIYIALGWLLIGLASGIVLAAVVVLVVQGTRLRRWFGDVAVLHRVQALVGPDAPLSVMQLMVERDELARELRESDRLAAWRLSEMVHLAEGRGSGISLILTERRRQVEEERYSPQHDDGHEHGELARAAAVYVLDYAIPHDPWWAEQFWPWDLASYKYTHDNIRLLVKAGALIAAEIDRLGRASAGATQDHLRALADAQTERHQESYPPEEY